MKLPIVIVSFLASMLLQIISLAGENDFYSEKQYLFESREFFIDFYGAATTEAIDETAGLGLGIGYYTNRNFGVIFNATWVDDNTDFDENDGGTKTLLPGHNDTNIFIGVLARLPIDEAAIAFYGVGGVGGYVGDSDSVLTYELGVGVEVRMIDNLSMLLEGRVIEPDTNLESETLVKLGVRILL
ncbi:MAG: outer membrane beta-barrel protein [Verrucomicrobiota bacterium]